MKNETRDVRMDGEMVIAGLSERTREASPQGAATGEVSSNGRSGHARSTARQR